MAAHHVILRLRVAGGFLAGADLELVDGLNCFIGGRGAGKTTALELLRFGLGLMPDPRTHSSRHRALDTLIKANLAGGRVSIDLRTKTDMTYSAGRGMNETVQVINETGVAVPVSLDRDQIFSADVFSQNEIEELASSPAAQLELLDRFQDHESAAIARELDELGRQLGQSAIDLQRFDQQIDDLRGKASERLAIEERLKGLAEVGGPDAAKINIAHQNQIQRSREAKVPLALIGSLQRVVKDIQAATGAFVAAVEAQRGASTESSNRDVLDQADASISEFRAGLAAAVSSLEASARATELQLQAQSVTLSERHSVQEAEYRAFVSESEELGGRAAERAALQASLVNAQAATEEQQAIQRQREDLAAKRNALLKRTSELRDNRFALRKRVAQQLTARFPSIRVTVAQGADTAAYRELVTEALKGGGVKQGPAAERLIQVFLPTELANLVVSGDHTALSRLSGFDGDRSRRIIEALKASGFSYAMETVELGDQPNIELLDGKTFKNSSNLSTGQRCTTILPILLVQNERPLLIDQPEDNLDNAFVFETIVTALRAVKGARQVIFVTHNPNIPVLGEAERVFVFASDGKQASLSRVGTVDECKDEIERILEGGRDAFLQRKARYGH